MELVYTSCEDNNEFFTIMIKNHEVVKYHYDGYRWRKRNSPIGSWENIEGGVNPLQIAKDMAKQTNSSLQFVVDTACGVIVSTIL